jgi:hypothetical protein
MFLLPKSGGMGSSTPQEGGTTDEEYYRQPEQMPNKDLKPTAKKRIVFIMQTSKGINMTNHGCNPWKYSKNLIHKLTKTCVKHYQKTPFLMLKKA